MNNEIVVSGKSGIELGFIPDHYKDAFISSVLEYYAEVGSREEENAFPCIEEDISSSLTGHYFQGCLAAETGMETEFSTQLSEAEATDSYDFWWDHLWSLYIEREFNYGHRYEFNNDIEQVLIFHHMSYYTLYVSPFSLEKTYYINNVPIVEVW